MILVLIPVVGLVLAFYASRLIYNLWCCPISIQKKLRSQGLKGPSYRFIHGNSKEIVLMKEEANKSPWELSQHDLFPRICPDYQAWIKLYGKNFIYWNGTKLEMVVTEAELVKEVLLKDDVYKKSKVSGTAKKYVGDGLLVAEGEKWSRLRNVANQAFHGQCLKEMFSAMVMSAETMLERWASNGGKEVDVAIEFMIMTSEVISRTAFGSSYLEGKNIFEMLTALGSMVYRSFYKPRFFGIEKLWRFNEEIESEKMAQSLRNSIMSLVRKREEMVKTGEATGYGDDFLGSLLSIHHNSDSEIKITVDDIIDECKVFYIAGHSTTSSVMPWIVVLLSTHTEWQEKAREEVLEVLGKGKPTPDGIARLKILTMIINEALRLYSPVVYIKKMVYKKTKLGKYEIPANTEVSIPPLALHSDPEIWGHDAHLFNPERFSEGVENATKGNPIVFLPFSYGPRNCVGTDFAMKEMKTVLAMILQRYRFALSPTYVHFPLERLTIIARHGVPIVLHPL